MWKRCMIVKVLGRNITMSSLNRKLRELWKPKGAMYVIDLPRQFFIIRFELEDEYMAALTGGPWKAFGSYLMTQAWAPDFDPLRHEITTTPVWVRLTNIPVTFYHKAILMGIAKGLGRPVKVDLTTLNFERARFARVCVEVNLAKPLKGTVLINGERYFVAYEGLTNICSGCGIYGHLIHACPKGVPEVTVTVPPQRQVEEVRAVSQEGAEFTTVQNPRRRATGPMTFAAGTAGGSGRRNGRNISENILQRDILTSNRFGELAIDTESPGTREVADLEGVDKENVNTLNLQVMERSESQGTTMDSGKGLDKRPSVHKTGPNDKRAGKKKATTSHKPNAKTGLNRPMRGLIFGPTRGELERSESGKRLRVEPGSVGRVGGVYTETGELSGDGGSRNLSLEAKSAEMSKNPDGGSAAEARECRTEPLSERAVSMEA